MSHKHKFIPSQKYPDYEFCVECDTYHSLKLMNPPDLYENKYWDEKNGHSYLGDQVNNLTLDKENGVSKVDKVMGYMHKVGTLLEIGCAPGAFLSRARLKGHDCWGIDPAGEYLDEVVYISGLPKERIIKGYFPYVKLPYIKFDHIIAMDVVEHIEDWEGFIKAAYDLLPIGGKFIFMSPMVFKGEYRERDLIAHEHAYIFGQEFMKNYLLDMFRGLAFDRWRKGHELFICVK